MKRIWRSICLFAYRRWATAETVHPIGIPGERDPDNVCGVYAPRKWKIGDFRDCRGDGHYLCNRCCHLIKKTGND